MEIKTQSNTVLQFECFSPKIDPHFPVVPHFFCSVIPWWRGQPARFGLEAVSEPVSLWNKSRRCPLIGSRSAPSVQKQKVSICFCFSVSVQSYSKQKQQGSILTAGLRGGGGFSLLAAWCSPLTWSRLNRSRPANDIERIKLFSLTEGSRATPLWLFCIIS